MQGFITDYSREQFWGPASSPVGGHSLSLFKRVYFSAFMAGAGTLVAEAGAVNYFLDNSSSAGAPFALSPVGEIGRALYAFSHQPGGAEAARGIPYVPAAIVAPSTLGAGLGFFYNDLAWDVFPLSDGERALRALLDALWPGSFLVERQFGTPASESGYMVAGPFGDAADLLVSRGLSADTLLGAYRVLVLVGLADEGGVSQALARELAAFVAGGGSLVLSAADAADAIANGWLPAGLLGFGGLLPPTGISVASVADLQTGWERAANGSVAPFCVEATPSSYYIKTGGDPSVTSGWDGGDSDKCCSFDAGSCVWFGSAAACEAALPHARCRACPPGGADAGASAAAPAASTDVGCPSWPAPGGGLPQSVFALSAPTTAQPLLEARGPGGNATCAVLSPADAASGAGAVVTLLFSAPAAALAEAGLGLAAHLLQRLADDLAPLAVSTNVTAAGEAGGVQLLLSRTPAGWLATLINDDGVTKQPGEAAVVDASRGRAVTLTLRPGWGAVAAAWASVGGALPAVPLSVGAGGTQVQVDVAAGDLVIVGLELA